ncbi:hypothetical protein MMC25_001903 [Agyrium rufum]|nr:hypothetical protein [Agyrium rufum]
MLTRSSLSICSSCLRKTLPEAHASRTARIAFPRRSLQTQEYQAFAPPPPSSLPKPGPPKTYRRTRKWGRRFVYLGLGVGTLWALDSQFYASSLTRSARTFGHGLWTALDYKINFRPDPPFAESIAAVHARNAERLFELLRTNGGLYLKIGQAIAMQSAVLPPEFQKMFARMFDDAPQNSWAEVEQVIREDFGQSVEDVFGVSFSGDQSKGIMEKKARASASVAQVHWARLADGREVAIKIQKKEIAAQVGWDLWTFKVVTWIYSKWFDIPFYSLVPYITERLLLETDFENEANNSERMAGFVAGESRLRDRVYIPKVYHELSSKRVMTAEWIEGVRLWDKENLTRPWKGPRGRGSPGCHGAALDPQVLDQALSSTSNIDYSAHIKPNREWWKGPKGDGGLGVQLKDVMSTMVDLFSAQMFLWGWVHCDPHPGNIFIRRLANGKPELVLIDHGLYIQMQPKFRHQYALFWKSLMTFDNATLGEIVQEWGINNADIFASATLMRPYSGGDNSTSLELSRMSKSEQRQRHYEMQQHMRKSVRDILGDGKKWPKELIFIGRNLRIVQGNNQFLGSPVNRIKITGTWASRALVDSPDLSYSERFVNYGRHLMFRLVLFSTDIVFYGSKIKQFIKGGRGMEDDIDEQMRHMMKDMGVELNHGMFDG